MLVINQSVQAVVIDVGTTPIKRAATGRTSTLAQPPADAPPPPLLLRRSCTGHRNSVSVARPSPTAPRTATASPHGPRLPAQPPPAEPATAQLPLPAAAPASRNSVTGPMHMEVANCCRYLAMVLYHAGDMAGAIVQQHKELIINERCLGLDHPDTAHRQ
nr:hypothetical protein AALP_AAs53585U000100 [Ipomoea trifida]